MANEKQMACNIIFNLNTFLSCISINKTYRQQHFFNFSYGIISNQIISPKIILILHYQAIHILHSSSHITGSKNKKMIYLALQVSSNFYVANRSLFHWVIPQWVLVYTKQRYALFLAVDLGIDVNLSWGWPLICSFIILNL